MVLSEILHTLIKSRKCNHIYHETELERYSPISGGDRKFICSECLKEKYFYIPSIEALFKEQEINDRFGKRCNYRLVRITDSEILFPNDTLK